MSYHWIAAPFGLGVFQESVTFGVPLVEADTAVKLGTPGGDAGAVS
jgi:hypothetical protein